MRVDFFNSMIAIVQAKKDIGMKGNVALLKEFKVMFFSTAEIGTNNFPAAGLYDQLCF